MKKILTLIVTAALALSMTFSAFAEVLIIGDVEVSRNTEERSPNLDASYIKTAPKMDGTIGAGEYNLMTFSKYNEYFNWTRGINLSSTIDDVENYLKNDMKVYMGWNGNDFYLALQATAPKSEYNCAFAGNESYLFRAWSLQVAITDIETDPEGFDRAEIGIGYDPASGGSMISYTKWGTRKNIKLTAGENFAANWDKDAELVTYEIKLDLASVLGKKAENEDLFRLGFCLNMGDGDISSATRTKQIELGYSIAVSKAVKNLATIALVGKGASDGDVDVDIPVDTEPEEEEQTGFDAADRYDYSGAAATFDLTNGSVEAKDMDENGDKFVRFTITGADPIIGSSDITQGLNMDNEGEYVAIRYRTSSEKGNRFAINFLNSLTTGLDRDLDCDIGEGLINDGQWHTMVFDMTGYDDWSQFISKLYLCPFYGAGDTVGETFDIQWIKYYSETPPVFEDEEYTTPYPENSVSDETDGGDVTTAPSEDETGATTDDAATNNADSSAVTTNTADTDKDDDKGGFPVGGIIGIVAAVVVAIAAVVFFVIKKKKA